MRCIPKTFPVFLNFLGERWPPRFPSTSNYACGASTANIAGLTPAVSQFARLWAHRALVHSADGH